MLKVAAYCRVSTDKNDQINSLESQKNYFTQYIERNPQWELTQVYVDDGITGTSTKNRRAFNRMMADAGDRRFDFIVTKEISRFARNTLDSILYTRRLKELGIGVLFMNDNINTLDPDAELRLTIMSSIAQEESRKTSERVKWGQKRRMEQGVVFGRDLLGYDVRGGTLYINEAGAETVRLIFRKFVIEEKGTHIIARELWEAGIPTASYMKRWSNTVILRILRNEKYCGDLIQKKTITPNYLNHEKKYNRGEEEFVVLKDHHTPIISRELFLKAKEELERRSHSRNPKTRYSNRYCFSGRIQCCCCGSSYISRTRVRKDGTVYRTWRCSKTALCNKTAHRNKTERYSKTERLGNEKTDRDGGKISCGNHAVSEEVLCMAMQQAVKKSLKDQAAGIETLVRIVKTACRLDTGQRQQLKSEEQLRAIEKKRQALLELYLEQAAAKTDFLRLSAQYAAEAARLKEQAEVSIQHQEQVKKQEEKTEQILKAVRKLAAGEQWDDIFYRHILDKITVYPNPMIEIHLKFLSDSQSFLIGRE